ncbi:hypothetical protein BC941DRAFT_171727 [Chlamydoabsidia padenii]|nr:hypothetical protein BC941DRAFT_171727 [Chlamydoabsidia padenii]
MSTLVLEWSVLEKLLLAQAVNKYGEDDWSQVARTLKQHPLLQDQSKLETFNQKNCSLQYYLMIENMDSESSPRQYKTANSIITQDMPKVVKLARQLYFQRIDDLKNLIKEDESRFLALISEIDDIKSGAMDSKLATLTGEPLAATRDSSLLTGEGGTQQDTTDLDGDRVATDETTAAAATSTQQEATPHDKSITIPIIDEHKNNTDTYSPATDASYQSASEFNDKEAPMEQDAQPEDQGSKPMTRVESDHSKPDLDTSTMDRPITIEPSPTELGSKRRHTDGSLLAADLDQHSATESSPKRQRLDNFEIDRGSSSPASSNHKKQSPSGVGNEQLDRSTQVPPYDSSETLEPESSPPATTSTSPQAQQLTLSPTNTAMTPETSSDLAPSKPILSTESSTEPKDGGDKEADGSDSVAESDSNAATPTTSTSDKRQSVSSTKDDPRQKSWQKNVNHLWREIANHKNGAMFMNPIKETQAPLYYNVVKYPLDLKSIKNRIRDGTIRNTLEFERDIILMLTNSLMYNKEGTEIYQMALEMLQDVTEQIKVFKSADSNGSTHTKGISLLAKDRRKSLMD